MSGGAQATRLPGGRLHLHHGPIDLIIGFEGAGREQAYTQAVTRFETLLAGLVQELPMLRRKAQRGTRFSDPVAQRMQRAVSDVCDTFITPMAAVAGSVADEILIALMARGTPRKAYVNNGGDIAFHLMPGETMRFAGPAGETVISAQDTARGIATSGWEGRSHSLGIADAVTVVAKTAAAADVAATLIANAVNLPGHPAIHRTPAQDTSPDSDLGARLVTTGVGALTEHEIEKAVTHGRIIAETYHQRGLILSAALTLRGETRIVGQSGTSRHAVATHTEDLLHA